jgi:phosphopentomutase
VSDAVSARPSGRRVLIVVCDSFGVGAAADADAYGDAGSNTLAHTAAAVGGLDAPWLGRLGLGCLTGIDGVGCAPAPGTAHGRMQERSAGKDTTTGHWEMAGVVLDRPFPTYPDGFPEDIIEPFEAAIGRAVLGNIAASGTEIIADLGEEHMRSGRPIVYTSADSVFQIATHVDVVPLEQLYEWCRAARAILTGPHLVGRVIARPFSGRPGAFVRTPDRRDYSVAPPGPTLLDHLVDVGIPVYGVGKIRDIFDGHGLTEFEYSRSNDDGVDITLRYLSRPGPSLTFVNLVDFDSKYGHRNDPVGYAGAVEAFDRRIPDLLGALGISLEASGGRATEAGGVMFVTGDHGCDPSDVSTDHTREYVPILVAGTRLEAPADLGTRSTFADLGATVAVLLGIGWDAMPGASFDREISPGPGGDPR